MMVRGLRLERAREVGLEPAAGALQLFDLALQPVDPFLDTLELHLESGDLRVARRDGRVRRGELSGNAVTVGGGRRPAASNVGEAGGEILSLSVPRPLRGLAGGVRGGG